MTKQAKDFNSLYHRYVFPSAPTTKSELIELFQAGLAEVEKNPDDIDNFEFVNLTVQGVLNSSPLYDKHPELEEINDEMLGFEDLEAVLTDPIKVQEAVRTWIAYIKSVPEKLNSILS